MHNKASTRVAALEKYAALLLLALFALIATAAARAEQPARVIVKYRADSLQLASAPAQRAQTQGARTQSTITTVRELHPRVYLVQAAGISAEQLASRLAAQADVEYAVPDRIKRIRAVPNDPLYGSQWNLQAVQPAAINAESAWDITQGSDAIIVAVIDTGIRPEHPDFAGKLVGGYDFISSPIISGNGDRNSDPSDPGDFVSAADFQQPAFKDQDCGAGKNVPVPSSWHGTQVAGVVGAATHNATGIASVGWNTKIAPIRVLGKCGGYDSDIIDGMRWAAGLPVSGVPANPNPARILNLSLGSSNACTQAYQDAINEITANGVLVVVAAGNSTSVEEPGNCRGVLTVAGLRHNGAKVGYSSFGPEAGIAAPAGNCVNTTGGCLFPIITTTNSGTTTPADSTYTDATNFSIGTSFAAPQAAGVAALMLSIHSGLMPTQLIQYIQASASPFPVTPLFPTCPQTDSSGQCNCTATTCGAGMLNAFRAVSSALQPAALIVAPSSSEPGETLTLDGSGSSAADGYTLTSYAWKIISDGGTVSNLGNADQAVATLATSKAGSVTLSLTVTDDAGRANTTNVTIAVGGPTPPSGNGGGGGAVDPIGLLAVALLAGLGYAVRRERKS
ncbi:MAG: S8 family serine peptidase [Betaproteobacteria bacterium]|nr:S8 family serine peptidase [Betaproteobacteria bacterium]